MWLNYQFNMEELEDYLCHKEKKGRKRHQSMFENDSSSLDDTEGNHTLEIEVKHRNPKWNQ